MAPRRLFNNKVDRQIEKLISRLPEGNIGYGIVGLNTLFYGLYCFWPSHNMHSFYNNFTFTKYGLQQGCVWNMFTSHFTHISFFSYLIDTAILFMFTRNLGMMFGNLFVAKTVLLSILMGSMFVFLQQNVMNVMRPFHGNDAILRGLIFSLIIANPAAELMLFPIPINIPAWAIAALLLGLDFFTFNTAAFGGVSAAYMMVNNFM